MDTWVDRCNIDGSARFKEDRIAGIAEAGQ